MDEGEIQIGVHSRGENLVFTVEDNGIGMTKEPVSYTHLDVYKRQN